MKKIILLLFLSVNLTAQTQLYIDSVKPLYACYGDRVTCYMHVENGIFAPSFDMPLQTSGGYNLHLGTYQDLVDSGFVWTYIVPNFFSDTSKNNILIYSNLFPTYVNNCYNGIESYSKQVNEDFIYFEYGVYSIKYDTSNKKKYLYLK